MVVHLGWVQAIAVTALVASCQTGVPTLIGQWSGNHPQGGPNTLEFREDGSVTWAYAAPEVGVLELTYDVDYSVVPHTFALHGFVGGPLDGMSLYGMIELRPMMFFDWMWNPARLTQLIHPSIAPQHSPIKRKPTSARPHSMRAMARQTR